MITTDLLRELKRRIPGIMESYGGTENFISYAKEGLNIPLGFRESGLANYSKASLYIYLNHILTYYRDIITISPWSLFVDLRETLDQGRTEPESINIDEPYRVYTLDGDLLYSVKNHFGAFGESRLDKNLVIQSFNTSGYFLKFKTYSGREVIKLLLVNMYSRHSVVSNRFYNTPEELKT